MNDVKTIELKLDSNEYNCSYIGNIALLEQIDFAFLCSSKCPGNVIIKTQEQAFKWREQGLVVASGFHSPVEKEVLNVLINGTQQIVIVPARSIQNIRIPKLWRTGLKENKLLIITPIQGLYKRPSKELCNKRNEFVSKLAKKVYIPYFDEKGKIARLFDQMRNEGKLIDF